MASVEPMIPPLPVPALAQRARASLKMAVRMSFLRFVGALAYGLPSTGGVALGLDRLLMAFLDAQNIEEIMLFPYRQLSRPSRASHDWAGDR